MKSPYDVVLRPVLTEQSYDNAQVKKYTFIVAKTANKTEIKKAVEQIFSVEVAESKYFKPQRKEKTHGPL